MPTTQETPVPCAQENPHNPHEYVAPGIDNIFWCPGIAHERRGADRREDAAYNHPDHYGGAGNPHEVIKCIHAHGLDFDLGNAVKYILRAGKKDPDKTIEDLRKAIWYIESEIFLLLQQ